MRKKYENQPAVSFALLSVVKSSKKCKLALAFLGNIRYAKGVIFYRNPYLIVIETIILFFRRSEGHEVRIF